MYCNKIWSEVDEEVKKRMIEAVKMAMIACMMEVPSEREITKRVKGFYANRRAVEVTRSDPDKKRKRRLETKKNRLNFVKHSASLSP